MGRENEWGKRHALPYHVVGSDASGVVVRVGSAVRNWKPGDRVTVHCNYVDDQDPSAHNDSMLATNQLIWGFETNFGGLADLAVVKANQLMPKPSHLTWEEAAVNALCSSTSYRMLVSANGAQMKQGDNVLIWGATGGIGGYAVQYVLNGGGTPVGVVSSPERAALLNRMGCEAVIDRRAENYQFWSDENTQDESEWRRFGKKIREVNNGEDVDIVFEHPGRSTMGASVFAVKRGGTIVTCAATSGYMVEFDNRHFWMRLKKLIGSHFANYAESYAANKLLDQGRIQPLLTQDLRSRRGRRCRARRAPQRGRGQARRAVPRAVGGPRHRRPREACPHRRGQDHHLPSRLTGQRSSAHCSMTELAAVLWDMDGTLVDTEPYWIDSELELVARHGGTWTTADAHSIVGFDLLDAGHELRTRGGVEMEPAEIANWLLDRVIARVAEELPWRPGARELLAECIAEGVPCAMVTMSWRSLADAVIAAAPAGSFAVSITGDEVTNGKPDPEPYLAAAAALGVDPRACVAIEDSPTGVASAVAAGCATLGVPHVVPVAAAPGLTIVDSLAGVDLARLRRLRVG